jgi:hypothetical protein
MPIFINLTLGNGTPIYVNASQIASFMRNKNMELTYITYANDTGDEVKEKPGEIMNKINMASTIETATTMYTDDSNKPAIYTL